MSFKLYNVNPHGRDTNDCTVRQMLQNGNLSQQDFERYRQQANQTTGMKL